MNRAFLTLSMAGAVLLGAGCAGPAQKLGRGANNFTEPARLGEMRRSIEQTALWEGADRAYTIGFFRGVNKTVARTAIGLYEMVTFPFPPYEAKLVPQNRLYPDHSMVNTKYPYGGLVLPEDPVYPDNHKPSLLSDTLFSTDTALGFSGGEVAPFIMGSRFHIYDK